MIKNIIFDIGGVVFDDKNNNLTNKFGISKEDAKKITQIAFGKNFIDCMLGKVDIYKYIKDIKNKFPDIKEELEYILNPKYYFETFPINDDVYKLINELYNKGYNLYVLSNNTYASYEYVSNIINLDYFKGFVCSYKEHLVKPDIKIYNLILDRYNLNKDETIFIDDNAFNVEAARSIGIKGIVYKSVEDINYIKETIVK